MSPLSRDDAELVARDPELPALAILLDEEAFRARLLRELPEIELGAVRARYLRYQRATGCLVVYGVEVGGAELVIHARSWRSAEAPRFERAAQRELAPGPLGEGLVFLRDLDAAVWIFPNDLQLSALRRITGVERRARLLRELAPDREDLERATLAPLAYKPARRFAGLLVGKTGAHVVAKLYSRRGFARRGCAERILASGERLLLPTLHAVSDRHRLTLLDWLPGDLLSGMLVRADLPGVALELAGAALAELHAQPGTGLPERSARTTGEELHVLAERVGLVAPERAEAAAALARTVATGLAQRDAAVARVPVHGDLHAKQIVIGDGRAGLLDLDRAALASRAEDFGNLFAELERDEALGLLATGRAAAAAELLLDGYRRAGGIVPSEAEIDLERAAALLRVSLHPFHNREPGWRARVELLLDRVEAASRAAPKGAVG